MSLNLGSIVDNNIPLTEAIIEMNEAYSDLVESIIDLGQSINALDNSTELLVYASSHTSEEQLSFIEDLAGISINDLNSVSDEALKYTGEQIWNSLLKIRSMYQALSHTIKAMLREKHLYMSKFTTITIPETLTRKINGGANALNIARKRIMKYKEHFNGSETESMLNLVNRMMSEMLNNVYLKIEGKVTIPSSFLLEGLSDYTRRMSIMISEMISGRRIDVNVKGLFNKSTTMTEDGKYAKNFKVGSAWDEGLISIKDNKMVRNKGAKSHTRQMIDRYDKNRKMIDKIASSRDTTTLSRVLYILYVQQMHCISAIRSLVDQIRSQVETPSKKGSVSSSSNTYKRK